LPYRLGGDSGSGIDCSALVQRTFRVVGLDLPRTAAKQFRQGCAVAREELMAGDLVFFHGRKLREITHVGIYIGGGRFIHAARHGVVVASLQASHWARRLAGARRLIEGPVAAIDPNLCIDGERIE
jgi:cell wall-associated NlpC family hydrolase